jgi:hypothetical protein
MFRYTEGKTEFIRSIEQRALPWYDDQQAR